MRTLDLENGDPIHIQGARLPKGKFVKLQPQSVNRFHPKPRLLR